MNSGDAPRVPNTTNIYFDCIEGEAMVIALDLKGLSVSTGAACSSGAIEPSHVLTAMGLSADRARASIRFSLGKQNTAEDVEFALGPGAGSCGAAARDQSGVEESCQPSAVSVELSRIQLRARICFSRGRSPRSASEREPRERRYGLYVLDPAASALGLINFAPAELSDEWLNSCDSTHWSYRVPTRATKLGKSSEVCEVKP